MRKLEYGYAAGGDATTTTTTTLLVSREALDGTHL
jgi:hypothetical protein